MKLKYYLVFTAFALSSCGEGFFEQYPSNDITEGNFYKTDDDFNQGVVSCYAKLKTMMSFHLTEIGYRSDENILESMADAGPLRHRQFHRDGEQRHFERHLGCLVQRHLPLQRRTRSHERRADSQLQQIPRRMPLHALLVVFQPLPHIRRGSDRPHGRPPGCGQTHPALHRGGDVQPADRRPCRGRTPAARHP